MGAYVGDKRYGLYVGDTRRKVMGNKERFTLIHHWSSDDNLVNSQWVDRIRGLEWTATGNVAKNNDGAYVCNSSAYFSMNMNNAPLILPDRYLIEVDGVIAARGYYMDFGSVSAANHAFGFGIVNVGSTTTRFTDNFKISSSASDINLYGVVGNNNRPSLPINERIAFKYGCKKYDDNNDIQYLIYEGNEYLAPNAHTHVSFDENWNKDTAFIGRCNTASYNAGFNIYELKIYQDNG